MKYKYCSLFLLLILSMNSCKKMLDVKPTDNLNSESYFKTEAHLESAITGVYDILQFYGGTQLQTFFYDADQGYCRGASAGTRANDLTPTDANVSATWTTFYSGINRANVLLANLDNNPEIAQAFRDKIRGEALFLRGYYYFMLVMSYGGVPLILTPITSVNETDVPRATAKETYERIIADMKTAESLVPSIATLGFGGRINKSAVRAMLARVCLHMAGNPVKEVARYTEARDWAKKVMDDVEAAHSLNPDYTKIYINLAQDKYDIKESIWEVEFWGNRLDAYTETGWVGYVNGPSCTNTATGIGFGGVQATANYYNKFQVGDLRRDWNIANFTYDATGVAGSKTAITTTTAASIYNRYTAKFRREYELIARNGANTPENYPLMRFADVLLMFAESENEINSGPTVAAYNAINLVRRRGFGKLLAGATNPNQYDLSGLNHDSFLQAIMDERSRELGYELMRKFDLIRWGTYITVMQNVANEIAIDVPTAYYLVFYRNTIQKYMLWPIPARELTLNRALVQNPGW